MCVIFRCDDHSHHQCRVSSTPTTIICVVWTVQIPCDSSHTAYLFWIFAVVWSMISSVRLCVCVCVYWVNMGLRMKAGRRKKKDFSFTFLYVYSYFTMFSPFLLLFFVWFIYSWETFQIMEVNDEHRKNTHNNKKKNTYRRDVSSYDGCSVCIMTMFGGLCLLDGDSRWEQ